MATQKYDAVEVDVSDKILFDGTSPDITLTDWLARYRPSQLHKLDGFDWIWVRLPTSMISSVERDLGGLLKAWESLQQSDRPINSERIAGLACIHRLMSGKWFIFVDTGVKVDHVWSVIARGLMDGKLGKTAKVSAADTPEPRKPHPTHVICVYNDNFMDKDEVFQLEKSLRSCGIKCPMKYKPDVYTILGIYHKNKWGIRPYIYESVYDIRLGVSTVR